MSDFNCATCGHSVSKHTVTRWPSWTKFCRDCNCTTGYLASWKKQENN